MGSVSLTVYYETKMPERACLGTQSQPYTLLKQLSLLASWPSIKGSGADPTRGQIQVRRPVVFSWIICKSRAHRDRVNAKVMKGPRSAAMCDPKSMPFEFKRMAYGGFKVLVDI